MKLRRFQPIIAILLSLAGLQGQMLDDEEGPQLPQASFDALLYARAQTAAQSLYFDLQSFICTEQVQRYRKTEDGQATVPLGALSSRLSFEKGVERYSDLSQNGTPLTRMSEVEGAWSNGDYGTLIRHTSALLRSGKPIYARAEELTGIPAELFAFEIPSNESDWDLQVADIHFKLPFHADIWVSQASGQILKISWTSTAIPGNTGIGRIQWDIAVGPVDLSGRTWMLPKSGRYIVSYNDSYRQDTNFLTFSNYHRYEALSVIRYTDLQ